MGVGGISLGGDKQLMGFLELALPLFLLLQKLSDPALQLLNLGLVGGIPVVQLLGHIHRGYAVLVAGLQCGFLICEDLKFRGCEDKKQ
jgi:hypothetical protein